MLPLRWMTLRHQRSCLCIHRAFFGLVNTIFELVAAIHGFALLSCLRRHAVRLLCLFDVFFAHVAAVLNGDPDLLFTQSPCLCGDVQDTVCIQVKRHFDLQLAPREFLVQYHRRKPTRAICCHSPFHAHCLQHIRSQPGSVCRRRC